MTIACRSPCHISILEVVTLPGLYHWYQEIGEQIFLTDLARELAEELGANPPQELLKVEKLKFDELDPQQPQAYLREQIDKFAVYLSDRAKKLQGL